MIKKSGRKQNESITNNDMLVAIEAYINEYSNERMNIKKLAEFSGIQRYYWYGRKEIKEKIESINNLDYDEYSFGDEKDLLKLPDVDSFIDNNYGSKRKLKAALSLYFKMLQTFFDSSCESHKMKKEMNMLINKVNRLEENLKISKIKQKENYDLAEYYKNEYYTIAYRSDESDFRQKNAIKKNVIDIEFGNRKIYSTNDNDLDSLINSIKD